MRGERPHMPLLLVRVLIAQSRIATSGNLVTTRTRNAQQHCNLSVVFQTVVFYADGSSIISQRCTTIALSLHLVTKDPQGTRVTIASESTVASLEILCMIESMRVWRAISGPY